MALSRPKVRGTDEAFASRLLGAGVTRTNALESLVIAGFVRGLSVRDVEASLADALGPDSTVSKSTVSRICDAIKTEFDVWKTRDLSGVELDCLFADRSFFRMHPGAPAEPVLVAWGITSAGKPVFLGLEPGSTESHDAWAGFFRGLKARALRDPLLVITDGGPGLIGAVEVFSDEGAGRLAGPGVDEDDEDGPVVGLHLGLGVGGHLGQQVAGSMDHARLALAAVKQDPATTQ